MPKKICNTLHTAMPGPPGPATRPKKRASPAAQRAARNAVRATRAAARGTFTDPISMNEVPVRHGILLNKTMYDPRTLVRWLNQGKNTVPHSRRALNAGEANAVRRSARIADGGEGWHALHAMFEQPQPAAAALPATAPLHTAPVLDAMESVYFVIHCVSTSNSASTSNSNLARRLNAWRPLGTVVSGVHRQGGRIVRLTVSAHRPGFIFSVELTGDLDVAEMWPEFRTSEVSIDLEPDENYELTWVVRRAAPARSAGSAAGRLKSIDTFLRATRLVHARNARGIISALGSQGSPGAPGVNDFNWRYSVSPVEPGEVTRARELLRRVGGLTGRNSFTARPLV